jgi:hypothetical protein
MKLGAGSPSAQPVGQFGPGSVADAFTSILYGIAVTQVALAGAKAETPIPIALTVILYFFIDWLSRIYLPSRLRYEERTRMERIGTRTVKSTLEVTLVFFLILIWHRGFISNNQAGGIIDHLAISDVAWPFIWFLLLTFLWNTLLLGVMEDLEFGELVRLAVRGNATNDPDFRKYGEKLRIRLEALDEKITNSRNLPQFSGFAVMASVMSSRAMISSLGQFIVNHLVWSPIVAAIVLFCSVAFNNGSRLLMVDVYWDKMPGWMSQTAIYGPSSIWFILALVFLQAARHIKKEDDYDEDCLHVAFVLAGIHTLIGILTFAVFFSHAFIAVWLALVASTIVPGIPYFLSVRRKANVPSNTGRDKAWVGGLMSMIMLGLAYLCLSAGELVLFLVAESTIVCLFLNFGGPTEGPTEEGRNELSSRREPAVEPTT